MVRYEPEGQFWDVVKADFWERRPFVFEVPPQDAPYTAQAVFDAVATDEGRDRLDWMHLAVSPTPSRVRDYVPLSLKQLGPRAEDGDWEGFFARLPGKEFGLNVHDLGRRNPDLAPLALLFDEHLTHVPGSPTPRRWELDTFAGTYRATPFGIHRDNASVFSFCLLGHRTVMLWEPDYFTPGQRDLTKPDADIIAKYAPDAIALDLRPGLGAYWPSGYWHVVLSDGNPFVVGQVSAYYDPSDLGR